MISAPGVGSGLDVNSIVSQLMAVERQPLNRLEADKRGLQAQLSAFGKLKSGLSTFQSAMSGLKSLDAFKLFTATSSDEAAFTATADSNAAISTNSIDVVQLAVADKRASQAIADTGTTTLGGSGDQMTITVNGNAFVVDGGGMTLSQLRDAINSDPNNVGVSASIISETSTSNRLVLTSNETGTTNSISTTFTGTLGTDLGLTQITPPKDAQITIDNTFTVTRSSNVISDALSGVTLTLKAQTAATATLSVDRDLEGIKTNVQTFVDAYNELKTTIDGMSGVGNDLEADSTLRSMENQMRGVFNTAPSGLTGSYSFLAEIGVSFQKDGTLSVDSSALDTAIATDFSGVADLFANDDQGYLFRLDSVITGFVQASGLIKTREDGLNSRIDTTDQRISDMEYRLQLREDGLRKQFTSLDELMGQLNGTSQFLTKQLAALP
ncbi:MAG: flagellar filament capping protein FliD [Thiogranum sp.]|jgi:flagellar hook-associated protein 2|nr:flagellar filament capping protein FliD [Thiogranum sp.]